MDGLMMLILSAVSCADVSISMHDCKSFHFLDTIADEDSSAITFFTWTVDRAVRESNLFDDAVGKIPTWLFVINQLSGSFLLIILKKYCSPSFGPTSVVAHLPSPRELSREQAVS